MRYLNCKFRIRKGLYCSCKDKTEYGFWFEPLSLRGINNVCSVCDYYEKGGNHFQQWSEGLLLLPSLILPQKMIKETFIGFLIAGALTLIALFTNNQFQLISSLIVLVLGLVTLNHLIDLDLSNKN